MIVELSAKLTTLLPLLQVFVEVELTVTLPVQNNPQSLRLFLMITSVTASKTNWKKNHVNRDGGGNQHINQFFPHPKKTQALKVRYTNWQEYEFCVSNRKYLCTCDHLVFTPSADIADMRTSPRGHRRHVIPHYHIIPLTWMLVVSVAHVKWV